MSGDPGKKDVALQLKQLVAIDRRLDNMRNLLAHKEGERAAIIGLIRRQLDRTEARIQYIDVDNRKTPKTDVSCIVCQRDMNPQMPYSTVRMVMKGGAPYVVHVADVGLLDLGILDLPQGVVNYGDEPIGADCAKGVGTEWTTPPKRPLSR